MGEEGQAFAKLLTLRQTRVVCLHSVMNVKSLAQYLR